MKEKLDCVNYFIFRFIDTIIIKVSLEKNRYVKILAFYTCLQHFA